MAKYHLVVIGPELSAEDAHTWFSVHEKEFEAETVKEIRALAKQSLEEEMSADTLRIRRVSEMLLLCEAEFKNFTEIQKGRDEKRYFCTGEFLSDVEKSRVSKIRGGFVSIEGEGW